MTKTSFHQGWTVGSHKGIFEFGPAQAPQPVTLPHDAMISRPRDPNARSGGKKGFYPDGSYDYAKTFPVPAEWKDKRITFEFEGAYMNAVVMINGVCAGRQPYGYSRFIVAADRYLRYGQDNELRVAVRSQDDSRWYTGTGLYRDVWLHVADPVHVEIDGVRAEVAEADAAWAVVKVAITLANDGTHSAPLTLKTELLDPEGTVVASDQAPVTVFTGEPAIVRQRLMVPGPRLWNVDSPTLYTCRTSVLEDGVWRQESSLAIGLRTLALDPIRGLRINGVPVKLRGACIHHDNGVLGSASIGRAEERRVEILKAAGFNALRSAHHPMSPALLDACDRLGMLVMDETFDSWTFGKSDQDYSLFFADWWEKDVEAMVAKDFHHPSVILYSIGNEIPETGNADGAAWGRRLAEKIRSLDGTRFILNSVNLMLSIMDKLPPFRPDQQTDVNAVMADIGVMMKQVVTSELASSATAETFAAVDIAGYNYADTRYVLDRELFPNRVICGSETFPRDIASNWKLVKENSHVIGDFTWTGWDYLGEAGIGKVEYGPPAPGSGLMGDYPWRTAWCGDIDITGHRRPVSYYREIAFGLRAEPYLAVQRPQHFGQIPRTTPWSWSDSLASWTWPGFEGQPIRVEVYADADEVELLANGTAVGRAAVGTGLALRAEFDTTYQPGELTAIAHRGGRETGRTTLRSARPDLNLRVTADRPRLKADHRDLAYLSLELVDGRGVVQTGADRLVTVTVEGTGRLQGLGSANPRSEDSYAADRCLTFDGRALAVVRPTGPGSIRFTVTAEGCGAQEVTMEVDS